MSGNVIFFIVASVTIVLWIIISEVKARRKKSGKITNDDIGRLIEVRQKTSQQWKKRKLTNVNKSEHPYTCEEPGDLPIHWRLARRCKETDEVGDYNPESEKKNPKGTGTVVGGKLLKGGEMIEVRTSTAQRWKKRKFLSYHAELTSPFYCEEAPGEGKYWKLARRTK